MCTHHNYFLIKILLTANVPKVSSPLMVHMLIDYYVHDSISDVYMTQVLRLEITADIKTSNSEMQHRIS